MNLEIDKNGIPDIAIIGNANSLLDKKNGNDIDKHRYVARFNNSQIIEEKKEYIGEKFNIWICNFYNDISDRENTFEHIFCPYPLNNPKYDNIYKRNKKLLDKFNPIIIPTDIFEELLKEIPKPSSGISFLFWLYKVYGYINKDSVFGFSFFTGKMHYFDESKFTTHNGKKEKYFFECYLNNNGVDCD